MASPSPAMGNIFKAVTPQIVREHIRAVDVHMHFIPEFYRHALASANMARPAGINALSQAPLIDVSR
jgi:hypothetical protein